MPIEEIIPSENLQNNEPQKAENSTEDDLPDWLKSTSSTFSPEPELPKSEEVPVQSEQEEPIPVQAAADDAQVTSSVNNNIESDLPDWLKSSSIPTEDAKVEKIE
jgi:hypothetical protein